MNGFEWELGRRLRVILLAAVAAVLFSPGVAMAQAEETLNKCQDTVFREGSKFVRERVRAAGTCLRKISSELIKKNNADASKAAVSCVRYFRRIKDSRGVGQSLGQKLASRIRAKCDPSFRPHSLADILGPGAGVSEPINASNIGAWCGGFGGSGAITSFQDWVDCVIAAHELACLQKKSMKRLVEQELKRLGLT